ncbi:MAG: serine/threonine-protein kinase [Sandaracinaceae bacterium]
MSRIPKAIGPYVPLARVSRAASIHAEVFKACDPDGGVVCLKRIHPSVGESVEFVARFAEEIELARQLEHLNLVRVLDHGEDGGHYFVMEWVDGVDLGVLLQAGPSSTPAEGTLPAELVVYLGVELCRALAYVHRSEWAGEGVRTRGPVVHGDLSPSNVLVGRQGFVKLADFGLARALGRTGARTLTEARGKPIYWAPEQFAGEAIGVETDLFALGLVLWRALIGTQPYAEGRPRGRMLNDWIAERTQHAATSRRSVREAAPDAPATLVRVIEGLLQPIERRIGSAEELYETLRSIEPLDGHAQLGARVALAGGRA